MSIYAPILYRSGGRDGFSRVWDLQSLAGETPASICSFNTQSTHFCNTSTDKVQKGSRVWNLSELSVFGGSFRFIMYIRCKYSRFSVRKRVFGTSEVIKVS